MLVVGEGAVRPELRMVVLNLVPLGATVLPKELRGEEAGGQAVVL